MELNLNVARVLSPTQEFYKARAVLNGDRLEVQDRARRTLATAHGTIAGAEPWTLTTEAGDVWTIERLRKCGCGKTTVTDLP